MEEELDGCDGDVRSLKARHMAFGGLLRARVHCVCQYVSLAVRMADLNSRLASLNAALVVGLRFCWNFRRVCLRVLQSLVRLFVHQGFGFRGHGFVLPIVAWATWRMFSVRNDASESTSSRLL